MSTEKELQASAPPSEEQPQQPVIVQQVFVVQHPGTQPVYVGDVTSLSWPRKNCICAPDMTAAIRFSSTFYICHPSQALALSSLNIKPLNNN